MTDSNTLTRADLAERIHARIGLSRAEASRLVETILDRMANAVAPSENVKLSGVGTFVLRDKNERVGRNPKTGDVVPITQRRVLTFRASQALRERVAKV